MVTQVPPLAHNVPIVDPDTGNPKPEFTTVWDQFLVEKEETDALAAGAVQTTRQIIAGAGLTGGGDLSADRTLNVGAGTGITVNADDVAIDLTAEAERIRDVIGTALVAGANITITVNDAGDTITIAASGSSGGGPLLPMPSGMGLAPAVASAGFGCPVIAVVAAFSPSAVTINGVAIPIVGTLAGLNAIPVIYGGTDPYTTQPNATGASLLASGSAVAMAANTVHSCPFTSPYTTTAGRWYWVGFSLYGATGNITLGITGGNRRQWYNSGTHNPAPATLPTMTAAANNNVGWWST